MRSERMLPWDDPAADPIADMRSAWLASRDRTRSSLPVVVYTDEMRAVARRLGLDPPD